MVLPEYREECDHENIIITDFFPSSSIEKTYDLTGQDYIYTSYQPTN